MTENQFTHPILEDDNYRAPLPAEAKTYELTTSALKGTAPLDFLTVQGIATTAAEIAYEDKPTSGQTQKRLIEHVRTLYRKNDLSGLLQLSRLESMALPGESYKRALTPGILDIFQSKLSRADLTTILTGTEGRYRDLDGNGSLWIPSGRIFFSPNPGDSAQQELAFAQGHFFLPHRFQDSFGNNTVVGYDGKYNLLLVSTRDAVGNEVTADFDYRVLQPRMMTDPNGSRTEVQFDTLGMVVGTAVMGKIGETVGDSFATFIADLPQADIQAYFNATNPRNFAIGHLGTATTRIIYDLDRIPVCAASIARETHSSDPGGNSSKVQLSFVYSDGFGREAQTKIQAEPGPQNPNDTTSPKLDPRWVGTGSKVYNNKGKPVEQYEPFFSPIHHFGIEKWGVSSTLFYDPVERVIATLHPNHTYEKVVFDPWQQMTYDVNDTVAPNGTQTGDPRTDMDIEGYLAGYFKTQPPSWQTWYQDRSSGGKGSDEQTAAIKAAQHADTPTIAHFDTLGRTFLSIADNGKDAAGNDQKYRTRTVLDIEGNQRQVIDAKDRIVMKYDYDMLGTRIHQVSMEAGERWMLNDAAGKPIWAWNSRQYVFHTQYDALHRPLKSFVQGGDPAEPNPVVYATPILVERTIYGDSAESGLSDAQQKQANLRGKVFQHFDSAGVVKSDLYDFKGNLLQSSRQLVSDYKQVPDWSQTPALGDTLTSATSYDALNRPVTVTAPDKSLYRATFNEANLLDKVGVNLQGAVTATPFVTNIDYNAKGQRTRIDYGNSATTRYEYDPDTFRLIHLNTQSGSDSLQDLFYTYDPAGNITYIQDNADLHNVVFFRNKRVEPSNDYTYDAIYRLIAATGREHLGQVGGTPIPHSYNDAPRFGLLQPGDGNAMGTYLEQYQYDPVGNFLQFIHQGSNPANPGWSRGYTYQEVSLLEAGKMSNRLSSTVVNGSQPLNEPYSHDHHGNMTSMPQLQAMRWNFKDELCLSQRQAVNASDAEGTLHQGERTYYAYDTSGQRVRKVTERQNGTLKEERIYLGGFEVYRAYDGTGKTVNLERETLHVMDDKQRIALVETLTEGNDGSPPQLIRHQFGNHLGSASLELDANAQVISYEEYTPYGSTSYQAVNKAIKAAAKRYRYTGKERDEETGYTYHGARYYAAWLGRWISCDPAGLAGGINSFTYGLNNPIKLIDPNGKDCVIPQQCAGDAMNDPAKVEAARYFLSMPVSKAMKEFGFKSSDDYNKFVGFLKQQGLTPRSVGAVDPSNKGQTQIGVDTNYHSQKQAYQDFQNAGNSVLASATYEGATAAGASPELRSNLTQLSSNVSDVAQVAAQTANARAQTKTAGKAVPDARKKVGGAPVDNTPTTTPVFDGLTKQEVDKAVDAAKGGTAFALPGQNPKTGEGLLNHVPNATATTNPEARISHADESTFTGIQGAGGKQVEFRRHSADKEAPSGKYALNNPVTVVNTVKSTPSGVLKLSPNGHTYKDRYLDPNGSFIKPKTDSQWDSVHHH